MNFQDCKLSLTELKLERLKDSKDSEKRQTMGAILVADQFVNSSVFVTQDARINTLLDETFQHTVRQRIYEDLDRPADNQSCIADIAVHCETKRLDNNNFRLDLETSARHQHIIERQHTWQSLLRRQLSLSLARLMFAVVSDYDHLLGLFTYVDIMRLS